ncbi:MAG: thiol-disulfide isomerase [Candidatus Rokuibacteriota bacterium]
MSGRIGVVAATLAVVLAGSAPGEAHRPGRTAPSPPPAATSAGDAVVTYHRDVAPILQRRCQECHRPGEVAPVSLLTYADARESASRIEEVLASETMPPWFADPSVNRFANDPRLGETEVRTLLSWVTAGAPEGDPGDAPPPRTFEEGWTIGKPELIVEMPTAFEIPAKGTLEYQFVVIPLGFAEDRWVQAVEIRPGNRAVVHHVTAVLRGPGSSWLTDVPVGEPRPKRGAGVTTARLAMSNGSIGAYTPGRPAVRYPPGRAMLIPAGSDLVLELHYAANGKTTTDRTRVGFVFAKEPPAEQVRRFSIVNTTFVIPPGDPSFRVETAATLRADVTLTALYPHMHLRGKTAEFRMVTPEGETRTLLRVSRYDPGWQLRYHLADELRLRKGTRLEATFVFDNSPGNPFNPDSTRAVGWGDQTWDEMALGAFEVVVPRGAGPPGLIDRHHR